MKFSIRDFKLLFGLFLIISLFSSCDFQPSGLNFVKVDSAKTKKYVEDITIELGTQIQDTFYVPGSAKINFSYKVKVDESKLHYVYLYVDTTLIGTFNGSWCNGSLNFPYNNFINTYKLTLVVTAHSGTGSLADILGAEGLVYTKSWVLIVYNLNLFKPQPIKAEASNGKMKISWEKYPFPDFNMIYIYKSTNGVDFYGIQSINADDNTESIYDDTYVGEKAEYRVRIYQKQDYEQYNFDYPMAWCTKDIPDLKYQKIGEDKYRLYWDKCRYPDNFTSYRISSNDYKFPTTEINDINKCELFLDNIFFDIKSIDVFLKITSKINDVYYMENNDNNSTHVTIINSEDSFLWDYFIGKYKNLALVQKNERFYLYDFNSLNAIDSLKNNYTVSPNICFSPSGCSMIIQSLNSIIYKNTTRSLNDGIEYNIPKILGRPVIAYNKIYSSCSDNGIAAIGVYSDTLYTYDFNNKKVTGKFFNGNPSELSISSTGKYIMMQDYTNVNYYLVLKNEGGTITNLNLKIPCDKIFFLPNEQSKVLIEFGGKIGIYDIETQSYINQITISGQLNSVDFDNGIVFIWDIFNSQLYFYDLNNNLSEIAQFKSDMSFSAAIFNGYIVTNNGIRKKIK